MTFELLHLFSAFIFLSSSFFNSPTVGVSLPVISKSSQSVGEWVSTPPPPAAHIQLALVLQSQQYYYHYCTASFLLSNRLLRSEPFTASARVAPAHGSFPVGAHTDRQFKACAHTLALSALCTHPPRTSVNRWRLPTCLTSAQQALVHQNMEQNTAAPTPTSIPVETNKQAVVHSSEKHQHQHQHCHYQQQQQRQQQSVWLTNNPLQFSISLLRANCQFLGKSQPVLWILQWILLLLLLLKRRNKAIIIISGSRKKVSKFIAHYHQH